MYGRNGLIRLVRAMISLPLSQCIPFTLPTAPMLRTMAAKGPSLRTRKGYTRLVHRNPPTKGAEKKKKRKKKMILRGSKGGLGRLELGATEGTTIRPCDRCCAQSIRVPSVDSLIALGCQGSDVSKVHLEGVRTPSEGLLDEVGGHSGDVELNAGTDSKRVARVPLELLRVNDVVGCLCQGSDAGRDSC